ncbi:MULTISPECIES: hypothetical protein [Ralstonia solanacearum species complex]|nr:hypothetical protein [Ralstonia solanacearum]QOK84265.1 hypothetical protein HF906_19355 [Ralstonia solanacearum]
MRRAFVMNWKYQNKKREPLPIRASTSEIGTKVPLFPVESLTILDSRKRDRPDDPCTRPSGTAWQRRIHSIARIFAIRFVDGFRAVIPRFSDSILFRLLSGLIAVCLQNRILFHR